MWPTFPLCSHLKEDLEKFTDGKDDLNEWDLDSEENSIYHFFKMHDYDKNNKLDGLEIGNVVAWLEMGLVACFIVRFLHPVASTFSHHAGEGDGSKGHGADFLDDEAVMKLIDDVMQSMDSDNDGYIDYIEYKAAFMSDEAAL